MIKEETLLDLDIIVSRLYTDWDISAAQANRGSTTTTTKNENQRTSRTFKNIVFENTTAIKKLLP